MSDIFARTLAVAIVGSVPVAAMLPTPTRHRWLAATRIGAIGHLLTTHQHRPYYPPLETAALEVARMAREMRHL